MEYLHSNTLPKKHLRAAFFLREYFFPFGCPICGTCLVDTKETWYGLCTRCQSIIENELEEHSSDYCRYCGKPLISEHDYCLSCRKVEHFALDKITVLLPYMGKYRKLLASYKFGKNIASGHYLAEKMHHALSNSDFLQGLSPTEARIVPVPPRPGKIKSAGWDQVEYVVQLLEKSARMPVSRCLKRLASKSQKELDQESRKTNLQGRIIAKKNIPKICVLVDDVITTGSTLEACAAALKEAGAQKIFGLCMFYS
jgi:ComF family protein